MYEDDSQLPAVSEPLSPPTSNQPPEPALEIGVPKQHHDSLPPQKPVPLDNRLQDITSQWRRQGVDESTPVFPEVDFPIR